MTQHDVAIVGLGAMGTAAADALARRGLSVLGLERFDLGHAKGSSHGESRIIRSVYMEGELYRPLLDAAYAAWDGLAARAGRSFLHAVGGLDISRGDDTIFDDALRSAEAAGVAHEVLTGDEFFGRYPVFEFDGEVRAVFAPGSGMLECDASLAWMREAAQSAGADLRANVEVVAWRRDGDGIALATSEGAHRARKLVLAAGPWTAALAPELAGALVVERQVVGYFRPADPAPFRADRLPIVHIGDAGERWYGLPDLSGAGFKFGLFNHARERGPEMIEGRPPGPADEALLRKGLKAYLPAADGPAAALEQCRFTLAADARLRFGPWGGDPRVILIAACSGHGFKFAPAIGDIVADMIEERRPGVDPSPFAW